MEVLLDEDGSKFKLTFLNENRQDTESPLENIKGINANITMTEILEAIKQGREDRDAM
jgi:hypothetical protein